MTFALGAMPDVHANSRADEDPIPGTVHLVDLERVLAAQHATGNADIILVPAPSSDPEDPLNWPRKRKHLAIACALL